MSQRRTQAVTLKNGETVQVLPREIPGLKAAGLLSKDTKARKRARVTPKQDAKAKAKEDAKKAKEAEAKAKAEADAKVEEAEKAAKEKEEKDAGNTKEEKDTGGSKEVPSGAITTENVNK